MLLQHFPHAGEMHPPTTGWGGTHIKRMSQTAHTACVKLMSKTLHGPYMDPDAAVTLQMEMQLPAAVESVTSQQAHLKDISWSLHEA